MKKILPLLAVFSLVLPTVSVSAPKKANLAQRLEVIEFLDADRKLLLDRFGASVERIGINVSVGDWLVYHVAHNRLRHKGSKFFAVTGLRDEERVGFVSDPKSENWSVCDEPSRIREFIQNRDEGTEARAIPIARPWKEGVKFMKKYTGLEEFSGEALWGTAPSTWIKFIVPENE